MSRADADTYAGNMGYAEWLCAGDDVKDVAIRRATQYLLARYRVKPEYLDPVHERVAAACCEAAVRVLLGPLYQDVDAIPVVSETVGPISTTYGAATRNGGQTRFAILDDLLAGLTDAEAGMVKMVLG